MEELALCYSLMAYTQLSTRLENVKIGTTPGSTSWHLDKPLTPILAHLLLYSMLESNPITLYNQRF